MLLNWQVISVQIFCSWTKQFFYFFFLKTSYLRLLFCLLFNTVLKIWMSDCPISFSAFYQEYIMKENYLRLIICCVIDILMKIAVEVLIISNRNQISFIKKYGASFMFRKKQQSTRSVNIKRKVQQVKNTLSSYHRTLIFYAL